MFRILTWSLTLLLLFAAVVQVNDPDPLRWIAIYGAASAVSLLFAIRGRAPRALPLIVAVLAAAWSLEIVARGPAANAYAHMFDAWEMTSTNVEEAREASGLFIVVTWMLLIARRTS